MLQLPASLLVLWACSIAYFDARYRRIPNVLSLGAWVFAGGLLMVNNASLLGAPTSSALWGAGLGLVLTLPAYLLKRLGAGDVKFLVGIGLLTSFDTTLDCFTVAAIAGAAIAMLWLSLPWLAHYLPHRLTSPQTGLGRWMAIPTQDRRMAFGTLFALGLMTHLWMERQR